MINTVMWSMKFTSSNLKPTLIRSIFIFALATFAAALIWTTLASQPSQAQEADDSDISWQGESLVYGGNTYTGPASESIVSGLGLREDTVAYTYTEPSSTTDRKTHVIYFAPGSDPGTANGANYRVYDYDGPGLFSNGNDPTSLTLSPATEEPVSSCQVEGGLGWFICPATNTLATFMDYLFGVLTGFLEVKPAQTDEENALYRAWSIMRTFANIAFVIAFLLIIYSQLTNFGISNYGIKKLLPRIIIAAILMNVSYVVCSLAIDISNLLGYGLQGVFINIRNSLVGLEGNTWDIVSWESVTSFVLAGSVAGAGAGIATISAVTASGGVGAAAVAILLPALAVVMFAVLVALLVLAARQAIITILVVISPLAFVAFLLPNTDKWFDKWRGLFMTMLILFPAFSLIFGGSQLAGAVIIQNATSINVIILGLLIQAAPLYVTPMLIKLSGSLIGRIAGMVNNPNRGIIDRTRNFAKDRAENMKAKNLSTPAKKWEIGKRAAQRYDHNRRRREGWRNVHNAQADANWAQTADFSAIDQVSRRAADEKSLGETISAQQYNRSKLTDASIQQLDVDVRKAKLNLSNAELDTEIKNWDDNHSAPVVEAKLRGRVLKDTQSNVHSTHDAEYEEFKYGTRADHIPDTTLVRNLSAAAQDNTRKLALNAMRNESASRMVKERFTSELEANTTTVDGKLMQQYAGGIDLVSGANRALASSYNAQVSAHNEAVKNAATILSHGNYSDSTIREIALGNSAGTNITVTSEVQEAAISQIAGGPNTDEIIKLMSQIDIQAQTPENQDLRQAFYDSLMRNGAKPKWATAGMMAKFKQGVITNNAGNPIPQDQRLTQWIADAFNANKFSSADTIVDHDKSYMGELYKVLRDHRDLIDENALKTFKTQYDLARSDNRYVGRIGDSKQVLDKIGSLL